MPSWLPLLNYSTKYNISLSTLRRRIKADAIEYRLDQGKYFIKDDGPQMPLIPQEPEPVFVPPKHMRKIEEPIFTQAAPTPPVQTAPQAPRPQPAYVEASVLSSANRLVEEIKGAYAKILQEKEEQITQLKEEIVDLRMLVRIMEESKRDGAAPVAEPRARTIEESESNPSLENPTDFIFGDYQGRS